MVLETDWLTAVVRSSVSRRAVPSAFSRSRAPSKRMSASAGMSARATSKKSRARKLREGNRRLTGASLESGAAELFGRDEAGTDGVEGGLGAALDAELAEDV